MILHLKELMKAMGVTSITLADKVGVSKATVSYWLNGKVFPAPETLEKIADALGVPVWQLFASPQEVRNTTDTLVCPNCGVPLELKIKEKE